MAIKDTWVLRGEFDGKQFIGEVEKVEKGIKSVDLSWSVFVGNLKSAAVTSAIKSSFGLLSDSIGKAKDILGDFIREASGDKLARLRLDTALKGLNTSFDASGDKIEKFEKKLYDMAKLTGGEVEDGMLKMIKYTNDLDKSFAGMNAAVELVGSGLYDMPSAIDAVGKSYTGFIDRDLGRILPGLKSLTQDQLAAGAGAKMIADNFKGMASVVLQTTGPALERLKANLNDVKSSLGAGLDTALAPMINKVTDALRAYGQSPEAAEASRLLGEIATNGFEAIGRALNVRLNDGQSIGQAINEILTMVNTYVKGDMAEDVNAIAGALETLASAVMLSIKAISAAGRFVSGDFGGQSASVSAGMASGGMIPGMWTGRDDRYIKAGGGEFVVNPVATAATRPLLELINRKYGNPSGGQQRGFAEGGEAWEKFRGQEIDRLSRYFKTRGLANTALNDQKYFFEEMFLELLSSGASPESILATAQNNIRNHEQGLGSMVGNATFFNVGGYWDSIANRVARYANSAEAGAMVANQPKMSLAGMLEATAYQVAERYNTQSMIKMQNAGIDPSHGMFGPEQEDPFHKSVYQRGLAPLSEELIYLDKYRQIQPKFKPIMPSFDLDDDISKYMFGMGDGLMYGPGIDMMNKVSSSGGPRSILPGATEIRSRTVKPGSISELFDITGQDYGDFWPTASRLPGNIADWMSSWQIPMYNMMVSGPGKAFSWLDRWAGKPINSRRYDSGGIISGIGRRTIPAIAGEEVIPPNDPRHSMSGGRGGVASRGGYRANGGDSSGRMAGSRGTFGGFQPGQGKRIGGLQRGSMRGVSGNVYIISDREAGNYLKRKLKSVSIDLDAIDEYVMEAQ